jgi:dTDP-4-amino-4,6-dideoxygalactose transaminase
VTASSPLFTEPRHVGCPNVGNRDLLLARIADCLDRRRLSNDGPYVQAFERRIESLLDVKHCIAVCNATLGLQVAIRALGLSGEVIVPSFTFPATVHALSWEGATPVFCDVDPLTHNICPEHADQLVTARTTGIVGVHLWGNACDVTGLEEVAARHGLRLLFDAAHAFGCGCDGRMIGNFGDAEVFSFHATKFVNAAEGGAIVTNDDEVAETCRRLRNFGLAGGDVTEVGVNAKMSELSGAMGLTSLESCDDYIARNRENYCAYQSALTNVPGLRLFAPRSTVHNFQYIVVDVDVRMTGVSRDQLIECLHSENVLAKRYFSPGCHRMEPYRQMTGVASLRNTERLCDRLLQLPTGSAIDVDDIRQIGMLLQRLTAKRRRAA